MEVGAGDITEKLQGVMHWTRDGEKMWKLTGGCIEWSSENTREQEMGVRLMSGGCGRYVHVDGVRSANVSNHIEERR